MSGYNYVPGVGRILAYTIQESIRRFTVAEWLTHSPATLDVTGSRHNSGEFSEIYFLESIQSPAQRDLNGLCDIAGINCDQ